MIDNVNSYFDAKGIGQNATTANNVQPPWHVYVDEGIRYIDLGKDSDGWVSVRLESDQQPYSVCAYTKLKLWERKDGRIYFEILDGRSEVVGKMSSMNAKLAPEYLGGLTRKNENLKLTVIDSNKITEGWYSEARNEYFNQVFGTLLYGTGICTVTLRTDSRGSKLPPGKYRVKSPDVPHNQNMTSWYRKDKIKHHDAVWFPIEYGDQSHYIHVGNMSHGCVTILEMKDWDNVYKAIIQNRTDDDGLYCAKITVVSATGDNSH